jgi:diguanylate cyclase (GGDEF)-like protein/PAS domain S-box-containing protein
MTKGARMAWDVAEQLTRSSDALVLVDDLGRVVSVTPRAAELLGRDDLRGARLDEFADSIGLGRLVTDRAARSHAHLAVGTGADGPLDVVVLPTEHGLALFVAPAAGPRPPGSRALLDKILSTVRDAVLVTIAEPVDDPGPIIVYANEALTEHSGYSLEELLGRTPRLLQGPGTDRTELDRLRKALEAWQPVTVELLNYRKDGTEFWIELDIVPLADADGWYTHWVSVQRDITQRRRAEAEREEQRRIVQTILDSLPAQTAMIAVDGSIMRVNQSWRDFWMKGSTAPEPDWRQINYLEVCRRSAETAVGEDAFDAKRATEGISSVLLGDADHFAFDYECWIEDVVHWFHLQAVPLSEGHGAVLTHTDITGRKRAEAELSFRATHDSLTGLPNRDLLRDHLRRLLAADRDRGRRTAVAFLDIDNFKDVNDAYGHAYGDKVIDAVGERLTELVREPDMVARLGGDEYVVVLTDLPSDWQPDSFMNRMRENVSRPLSLGIASVRPSVSAGIVTSPPHPGDPDAILRDADAAMYQSKREGRDRWTLFTSDVRDGAMARAITTERIADALERGLFELHYQPVVDLRTGRTIGSEALLRMRALDGSLLLPGHFLAAVDSGPLASEVGAWVLDHAIAQQAQWLRATSSHRMSINVSPRQLGHGELPDQVAEALARHRVPAESVVLEITEEVMVAMRGQAVPELQALRRAGVRVAIDDFGTGYSSLSYLQGLEIDVLKIDRVFLEQAGSGDAGLITAIVSLADAVGADTVAEGVESRGQVRLLAKAGVHLVQGFLLGRPQPAGARPGDPLVDPRSILADVDL